MNKFFFLAVFSFLFFISSNIAANDFSVTVPKETNNVFSLDDVFNLSNKEMSEAIGHKLTLRERIGLGIMKHKLKKALRSSSKDAQIELDQFSLPKGCSKIVLKNGNIIEADIIQITPIEVKYKRCGKANDPEIIVSKRDVLSITTEDGEVIFRNTGNGSGSNYGEPKLDGLAIASLATGVGGLVIGLLLGGGIIGILAGIVGIVLGGISILRMRRDPDKYRGKGMAWAGMICGIVIVGLFVVLLAVYV